MEGSRLINTKTTDKMTAMDVCEKMMREEGKDLRSIVWVKEDEEGFQWFEVTYTVVETSAS